MTQQQNVVPFDRSHRMAAARRGSPDKAAPRDDATVELECPYCSAVICLEAALLVGGSEVLCAGCDGAVPVPFSQPRDLSR